ncbi:NAD(P)H-quinone oxidoreductase [bacterium]|nr:NAD(P)H-quinone oxidoreductase [bacterium]
MRAIVITAAGGPEVLQLQERSRPDCTANQVLVAIKATAINRADTLQRKGKYPAPADVVQDVLGLEYAGVVEAVGAAVQGFKSGDRVFGLAPAGTYQEYLAVESSTVMHLPSNISYVEGAAIPEAYITAYDAICLQADLKAQETLLVSAAASGVGIAAAQIAKAMNVRVLGTVRQQAKAERIKALFDQVLTIEGGQFANAVNSICPNGADVVLELVGGNYVEEDLKCIARLGRIMVVGLLAGAKCELNLAALLTKRVTLRGTSLRSRSNDEKAKVTRAFEENILPYFVSGAIKPIIEKVFPLELAAEAHALMEADQNIGKIVLNLELNLEQNADA